jgi:hypothetical protein
MVFQENEEKKSMVFYTPQVQVQNAEPSESNYRVNLNMLTEEIPQTVDES